MACGYYVYLFTQVVYILPSYGLSLSYLTLFPVTQDLVGVPSQIPYQQLSVANAFHLIDNIVVFVKSWYHHDLRLLCFFYLRKLYIFSLTTDCRFVI